MIEFTRLPAMNGEKLVTLLVNILNGPLRNHLTQHQARFRHWWDTEIATPTTTPPQETQKKYPGYSVLLSDIKEVQKILQILTNDLKMLAHGGIQ